MLKKRSRKQKCTQIRQQEAVQLKVDAVDRFIQILICFAFFGYKNLQEMLLKFNCFVLMSLQKKEITKYSPKVGYSDFYAVQSNRGVLLAIFYISVTVRNKHSILRISRKKIEPIQLLI